MRGLLSVLALASCLAAPVHADASSGPIGRFFQREGAAARAHVQSFKATLADPAKRKHLIGTIGVTTAMIAVGDVIELALRHEGIPSVGAIYLGAALPTYAQYYLQGGLAKLSSRWFARPKKQTQVRLVAQSAFAGVVGLGAAASLNEIAHVLPTGTAAAVDHLDTTAGVGLAALRWGVKKAHDQAFGIAANKAKNEALSHRRAAHGLLVPVAAMLK